MRILLTCIFAACAAALRARGRQPAVFSLLSITLFPLGRAARVKVSDAFRLPPNCHCDRQGIGCHPRGRDDLGAPNWALGRSVAFTRTTGTSLTSPALPPRCQAQNRTAAILSQSKFFHRMWTNLFAVAGIREHPPAGVIRKRGRSAPSCARGGRAGRIPAREARALSPPPFKANPGCALCTLCGGKPLDSCLCAYAHKKQERPDFRPAAPAIKGRIESRKQEHVGGSYAFHVYYNKLEL